MATGTTTVGTLLATLKAHAAAVALASTVVVGGGAAALAATGHLDLPGNGKSDNNGAPSAATQAAQCAGHNGDAENLAATYKSMFGGSATTATKDICTIFVGTSGRHYGFGEVRQILNIAAAIENKGGADACLSAMSEPGNSGNAGTPPATGKPTGTPGSSSGDHGRPTVTPGSESGDHAKPTGTPGKSGDGSNGQPLLTIPPASAATTMAMIHTILSHDGSSTPLARLAQSCGARVG
jgi:hypothetical protein